jgi:hypothetical protein
MTLLFVGLSALDQATLHSAHAKILRRNILSCDLFRFVEYSTSWKIAKQVCICSIYSIEIKMGTP